MKYTVERPDRGRIVLEDPRDFLVYRQGSGHTIEILDIQVDSERRKGKGRRLVDLLIRDLLPPGTRLVWAISRADNRIAHEFYYGTGFRVIAPLFDFYRDQGAAHGTIDAIMFGKSVGG